MRELQNHVGLRRRHACLERRQVLSRGHRVAATRAIRDLEFEATRGAPVSPIAVSQLRARYEVLPPEAQALDAEAEADACALLVRDPADG